MYFPIPESVNHTDTKTVSRPELPCGGYALSHSFSATFSIQKSSVPLLKKDDFVLKEVNRPTGGKWSEIKKSGSIKMTPMSIRNEKTEYLVGQVHNPYIRWAIDCEAHVASLVDGHCVNCKLAWLDAKAAIVKGSYIEQGDLDYWKSKYPNAAHYMSRVKELDEDKIEAAKSEAIAELYQSYNLGEEVAELRETIVGVAKLLKEGISLILRFRGTADSLLKKGLVEEAGSRWMEFRYGIMPIIYSIQDLLEINSKGKYVTVRKTVRPDFEVSHEVGEVITPYFETVCDYDFRVSITAKARWASQTIKNVDRININPLTTFTAVLPWSMVVRWFFNVQSYLDARVKSLTSLALEQHACVAVREKRDTRTYLHVTTGYESEHVVWAGNSGMCGAGFYGVHDYGTYSDMRPQAVLLSQESVDNYHRYLFQPSDVKLVFNPYINWKRSLDSIVLTMGSLSKLFRSL